MSGPVRMLSNQPTDARMRRAAADEVRLGHGLADRAHPSRVRLQARDRLLAPPLDARAPKRKSSLKTAVARVPELLQLAHGERARVGVGDVERRLHGAVELRVRSRAGAVGLADEPVRVLR